ncbi:gypsy/ty3 retroelement polyprotein [Tanacetum coccineum]|uniref:Gypsy/ty3 retroelement polyprotein n=1 Tax=Tanacetum coccineum TaxID=301880 RepID=A0ABQ5A9Y1_9ASTR
MIMNLSPLSVRIDKLQLGRVTCEFTHTELIFNYVVKTHLSLIPNQLVALHIIETNSTNDNSNESFDDLFLMHDSPKFHSESIYNLIDSMEFSSVSMLLTAVPFVLTGEYLEDSMAQLREMITGFSAQNNQGARQGSQFSRLAKVEFSKFYGEGSSNEYQDTFDTLLCRVEVSEEHAISLYLEGLPTELEMSVRMFRPRTLSDAYSLTTLQEATLKAVKKKSGPFINQTNGRFGINNASGSNTKQSLLLVPTTTTNWKPKPNTPLEGQPRKQLTQKEYEEKRSKNLCFYCDQKYVSGHKCTVDTVHEEVQAHISLNTFSGTFTADVMLLLLGGYDMTLGIQWLSTLGDIKWNFQDLKMEFLYNNRRRIFEKIYLDDHLIYNKSLEDHDQHLTVVLSKMKDYSLYAKESKCVFGTTHAEYLGHVISSEGVATDPFKVQAMQTWPIPITLKQLRGFLRLTGYYRRFIKNFASISRPLT